MPLLTPLTIKDLERIDPAYSQILMDLRAEVTV
jgi:hypothetical protein